MIHINLLPWRKQVRQQQKQRMQQIILITTTGFVFVMLIVHWVMDNKIRVLTKQINQFESQIIIQPAFNVITDISIQKANHYRLATHDLFVKLLSATNAEVCFTEITRKDNVVTFFGHALTAAALTEFLKHWEALSLFSEVKIDHLQAKDNGMAFQFRAIEVAAFPYTHHGEKHHAAI